MAIPAMIANAVASGSQTQLGSLLFSRAFSRVLPVAATVAIMASNHDSSLREFKFRRLNGTPAPKQPLSIPLTATLWRSPFPDPSTRPRTRLNLQLSLLLGAMSRANVAPGHLDSPVTPEAAGDVDLFRAILAPETHRETDSPVACPTKIRPEVARSRPADVNRTRSRLARDARLTTEDCSEPGSTNALLTPTRTGLATPGLGSQSHLQTEQTPPEWKGTRRESPRCRRRSLLRSRDS